MNLEGDGDLADGLAGGSTTTNGSALFVGEVARWTRPAAGGLDALAGR